MATLSEVLKTAAEKLPDRFLSQREEKLWISHFEKSRSGAECFPAVDRVQDMSEAEGSDEGNSKVHDRETG